MSNKLFTKNTVRGADIVAYLTELELLRVLLRLQDDPLIVAYTR